jgi:hypothetical protein
MAGYSGTPLPKKLGIKEGTRLGVVMAPAGFERTLGELPQGAELRDGARGKAFDVLIAFYSERRKLELGLARISERIAPNGALWIAWPKKASGVKTDVTEDTVRAVALPLGLVDNKVCALDEVWSGLRLVFRLSERPGLIERRGARLSRASSSSKRSV